MKDISKLLMKYLYRREWKEKYVTLSQIAEWTKSGKYRHRVDAARGFREISVDGGMVCGPMAAEELPKVMPAKGAEASYTGLVLLSFRVDEGVETLERLRRTVNLWEQTGITGTVLLIIFHLLHYLYYSERDIRRSCRLANGGTYDVGKFTSR